MWVGSFSQVWDAGTRHKESASYLYVMHQVKTPGLCLFGRCKVNGTGIIYQDINSSECSNGLVYNRLYLFFVAYITLNGKSLNTQLLNFFCSCINGPFQLWMGLCGFSCNNDIGPF